MGKNTDNNRPRYRRRCAYPFCSKNTYPPTKGFCKEHFEEWQAGLIEAPSTYLDDDYFDKAFNIKKMDTKTSS